MTNLWLCWQNNSGLEIIKIKFKKKFSLNIKDEFCGFE